MASQLIGKFKLTSQENFDQFLAACGIQMELPNAEESGETFEIIVQGDQWTTKTWDKILGNWSITFKLGQEFDHDTPDGRHVKSLVTINSGRMIWTEKWNNVDIHHIAEVSDGELIIIILVNNIRCIRKFQRT